MSGQRSHWRLGSFPWLPSRRLQTTRSRVIIDNDFIGDPDDVFQLAHHLLSTVDIRAVISSHLDDGFFHHGPGSAQRGLERIDRMAAAMGLDTQDKFLLGADAPMLDRRTPQPSPGADRIIREARSLDGEEKLFVACGGGLTSIVSACLMAPEIQDRITVVWIGGSEYSDDAATMKAARPEYNLAIDAAAARALFEDLSIVLWQIPRDVYRQCMISEAELIHRVLPAGPLGNYLMQELWEGTDSLASGAPTYRPGGDAVILGDSPLVLLTASLSYFEPASPSCRFTDQPAPQVLADGRLTHNKQGRSIRVLTHIDTRLMFEDMFAKLQLFAAWQQQ